MAAERAFSTRRCRLLWDGGGRCELRGCRDTAPRIRVGEHLGDALPTVVGCGQTNRRTAIPPHDFPQCLLGEGVPTAPADVRGRGHFIPAFSRCNTNESSVAG